jgi:hypothetical protein
MFRVENENLQGPYWNNDKTESRLYKKLREHEYYKPHLYEKYRYPLPVLTNHIQVGPFQDIMLRQFCLDNKKYLKTFLFGFSDIKQLRDWFDNSFIIPLKSEGYYVSKYKCGKVIHGHRQAIGLPPFEILESFEL